MYENVGESGCAALLTEMANHKLASRARLRAR